MCQTVWIQIRPDVLLGLIWVQTVCNDQQHKTKFAPGRQRVKALDFFFTFSCILPFFVHFAFFMHFAKFVDMKRK